MPNLSLPERSRDLSQTPARLEPPQPTSAPDHADSLDHIRRDSLVTLYGDGWQQAGKRLDAAVARDPADAYARLARGPGAYGAVTGDPSQADRVARTLVAREQVLEAARQPTVGTERGRGRELGEVVVVGHRCEADREHFRPRAPHARYPALDERLDDLHAQIDAGGPGVETLRDEAALIQATYDAARYLGAPGMTPTHFNPVGRFRDQAMTVPYSFGTIFANDVHEMIDELPHMVQHHRDPVGFISKILQERALFPGQETYDIPGWLEHEGHTVIKPDVLDWIEQIKNYNAGWGPDPYSPNNALFQKLMDYPDIERPQFGRPAQP